MPADKLEGVDKMPLQQFVELVADALIGAHQAIEVKYPEWRVGTCEVTLRGVVKPGTLNGKPVILLDVDEPAGAPITEIPLPLQRKP